MLLTKKWRHRAQENIHAKYFHWYIWLSVNITSITIAQFPWKDGRVANGGGMGVWWGMRMEFYHFPS